MRTSKSLCCCCSINLQAFRSVADQPFLSDSHRNFSALPQKSEEPYNPSDYRAEVAQSNEPIRFLFSCRGVELYMRRVDVVEESALNRIRR